MSKENMTPKEHRARHEELHRMLDELLADFIVQNGSARPSATPIMTLVQWSYEQTLVPTNNASGSLTHPDAVPHTRLQIAQEDAALIDWLLGIDRNMPHRAGDFLHDLASAALRADPENYPILRPALLHLRKKFPQYECVR